MSIEIFLLAFFCLEDRFKLILRKTWFKKVNRSSLKEMNMYFDYGINILDNSISVNEDENGLITIYVSTINPLLSKDIATYISEYIILITI